jgi:hypothetical protein
MSSKVAYAVHAPRHATTLAERERFWFDTRMLREANGFVAAHPAKLHGMNKKEARTVRNRVAMPERYWSVRSHRRFGRIPQRCQFRTAPGRDAMSRCLLL